MQERDKLHFKFQPYLPFFCRTVLFGNITKETNIPIQAGSTNELLRYIIGGIILL